MRLITHALRCLSLALVLVAAFAALMPAEQAAARSFSPSQVKAACEADNHEFYFTPDFWSGRHEYGCRINGGESQLNCWVLSTGYFCDHWGPHFNEPGGKGGGAGAPNKPEQHIGDPVPDSSHPAGGEVVDQRF